MRNIQKRIADGKELARKKEKLDLKASELVYFLDDFHEKLKNETLNNTVYDTIVNAYLMGLSIGYRNAKKER